LKVAVTHHSLQTRFYLSVVKITNYINTTLRHDYYKQLVAHSRLNAMPACSTKLTNLITCKKRFYLCITRVHHLYATYTGNRTLHWFNGNASYSTMLHIVGIRSDPEWQYITLTLKYFISQHS